MLHISFPTGANYGWGILGKYIAQEMARLTDVRLWTGNFTVESVGGELDYHFLQRLLPTAEQCNEVTNGGPGYKLKDHLLTAVDTVKLAPRTADLRGTPTVGYTVYEDSLITDEGRKNVAFYDYLIAGSSACEQRLRAAGINNVSTVIHGIDPTIFDPHPVDRRYLRDKFVIFSGGKLELRKGQDVVVRAVKVLQDRHPDVMLVAAWSNPWPQTIATIQSSKLVRFNPTSDNQVTLAQQFLSQNGLDVRRAIVLAQRPNVALAPIYKQTDVGLFPNRCEGGTNLVLMEYMACGKPAIATFSSGHRDILTSENSIPLRSLRPVPIHRHGQMVATWDEPDLEEVIAALEYAYTHRDQLARLARQAGQDLQQHTWLDIAKRLLAVINGL